MKKLIIPLLTCFILISCSPHSLDEEKKAKELAKSLSHARSDLTAISSYEIETISFRKCESEIPDMLKSFYQIKGVPIVNRSFVENRFLKNSGMEMDVTILEPTIKIPTGKHNIPPDTSPKAKYVNISNNNMKIYDENHKLLGDQEFPTSGISSLISTINNIPSGDITEQLSLLKANGSTIQELSPNILSIKSTIKPSDLSNSPNTDISQESVSIYDIKNKIILGSTLYDLDGKVLEEIFYKYDFNKDGKPTLNLTHSETRSTDNHGVMINTITDTYYKNYYFEKF